MRDFWIAYVACLAVMSLLAFAAYGGDKWQARREGRRVPESWLHLLSLLGGWPGAFAAQRLFRHKTRKFAFQVVFWLSTAANLAAAAATYYLLQRFATG